MADVAVDGTNSPLPPQPQLFQLEPIDVVEPWQQELVECFQSLTVLVSGKSQVEIHERLQQKASESMRSHGELVNGLIYGILTAPSEGNNYFRLLNIVSRDGFAYAIGRLQLLATAHKFALLRIEVRAQLFWVLSELVKIGANGVDQVLLALTRQVRSGDVTQSNVRLCRLMLQFMQVNYSWLVGFPVLTATTVYMFGRLVLDHSRIVDLRTQECELVVRLLRERFNECSMVGRDLVRMLQDVAQIPIFRDFWKDMMHRPQSISPLFGGIEQLLRVPTPRMFLANRITYEMENRLLFMLEQLPASSFSRSLMWFVHRYLSTPESESLFSDLIRFIVGVVHPSNAVLASNVVPRYVFLGGLLRFIRSQVVAANAKLALFYDWLFYNAKVDNIMNIEPGVLIIMLSVDKYAFMTSSFVEFLAYAADAYAPTHAMAVRLSVGQAMQDAVAKGVVLSIMPVYEHPKIEVAIRQSLHYLFPQLVPPVILPPSEPTDDADTDLTEIGEAGPAEVGEAGASKANGTLQLNTAETRPVAPITAGTTSNEMQKPAAEPVLPIVSPQPVKKVPTTPVILDPVSRMFQEELGITDAELAPESLVDTADATSDSDDIIEIGSMPEDVALVVSTASPAPELTVEQALEDKSLWLFGSTLKSFADGVSSAEPDVKQLGGLAKDIVDMFAQSEASERAIACILSAAFSDTLEMEDVEMNAELAAAGESDEALEHDLLHYMLATATMYMREGVPARDAQRVLRLLVQLTEAKADVGFRWLLYSAVGVQQPWQYVQYVDQYAQGSLEAALVRDLSTLQERFPGLFYTVLPQMYVALPGAFSGCRGIVKSVIALIDQPQVYRLNMLIARGQLQLFGHRRAAIAAIIGMMLECDAFEQVCLWQLLGAELGGDTVRVSGVARYLLLQQGLDPASNSEAASGLLVLLRATPPSLVLLKTLAKYTDPALAHGADNDTLEARADLCGSVLTAWLRTHKPALLGLLSELVSTLPAGAAESMVSRWVGRFSQQFGGAEAVSAEIRGALAPKPAMPVEPPKSARPPKMPAETADVEMEEPPSKHMQKHSDNERKRRNTGAQRVSRQSSRQREKSQREISKRRRRNVDTSDDDMGDDDDDEDDSDGPLTRGRRRRASKPLPSDQLSNASFSSSPILSSSSVSSDSD
ncbi:hypothetical protein IWW50_001624 [Coemansia erecta]|nr:hypothetical protein GGF43_001990 [Coemansia sp. RSA 2618]KAJ2827962.1 hypothetical protein IWW50_001624 [Coemansia erecta]